MTTEYRKEINDIIEARKKSYTDISDAIWGFAESRFQEYESSKVQQEYMKSRGFSVKADLSDERFYQTLSDSHN